MRTIPTTSALLALLLALPLAAAAHGPTIRISYGRVAPVNLSIRAGDTVHFQNQSTTPRTFTVRAVDGAFESPAIERGTGWHHTFEAPGRHPWSVVEFPDLKGVILVGARSND